jgi:multiple sugar transport system ATP-binding protein
VVTLTLDRVSKVYGQRGPNPVLAVDGVEMAIDDGEIVGLLGSSGCGKTSTLRMIAGFEDVTSGEIRLGGRVINQLAPARRNVAMAF